MHQDQVWEKIKNIPDEKLWNVHNERKIKLLKLVKISTTERLRRSGYSYEEINEIVSKLNPDALTIGFARRFATYKRATLIFKDLERITQILNNSEKPVQLIWFEFEVVILNKSWVLLPGENLFQILVDPPQ